MRESRTAQSLKKVVKESGFGQSSGGRRPILYEFNEKVVYAIGVDFEIPELTLVLTDSKGPLFVSCSKFSVTRIFLWKNSDKRI